MGIITVYPNINNWEEVEKKMLWRRLNDGKNKKIIWKN